MNEYISRAEFTDEETIATRKLKRGLFHILKHDENSKIPYEAVKLLDLLDRYELYFPS